MHCSNRRLIALCSPAMGSGKSTVAQHLVANHDFVRVAFAAPLKRMIRNLLENAGYPGVSIERYVDGDLKEQPLWDLPAFTRRHATAMLAALGPVPAEVTLSTVELIDTLVAWGELHARGGATSRYLQQRIGTEWGREVVHPELWVLIARDRVAQLDRAVIDDMRFPNEYDAIVALGGDCYRVVRPGATVATAHASEGQLDRIHMPEIWNTGTIDELVTAAEHTLQLSTHA